MAEIVLINPRFEMSYWGMEHALPLLRKRANLPVAALPLLAALTPGEHNITLLDENVDAIDYDRLASADIVGVTGMIVQRFRMREVLKELKVCGDIIVTFGRRPRLKTSSQVIAELEALRAQKIDIAFIVDDNLIGNKKAIKLLLRDLIAYQQANGYPFDFFTEASLDLAEDEELMRLMVQANIISVFVGIESPNEKSLRETRKFQNVRPAGTLVERVHRIQEAGIEVWCGMILGFDHDDETIFDAQVRFITEARTVTAMTGMLT